MSIEITRAGKMSLEIHTPVMPAAGTFGFGDVYRDVVNIEKIGAIVTAPVTYDQRSPASGPRVVPLDAGILVHTGLPNPGLNKVLKRYRNLWLMLPVPIIVHLVGTTPDQVRKSLARLEGEDSVNAVELGLNDDISVRDAEDLVNAALEKTEKPLLVRLPLYGADHLAEAVADCGASALVVAAPPRGTARDPISGRLVSGRIYGPLIKPISLRMVGQLVRRLESKRIDIPVIGAGGIHSAQDARDYLEAGARAVQVDSVTWVQPKMLEIIARDLGGWTVTREAGALPDEWYPGMGDTERERLRAQQRQDATPPSGD
ncbi:MAG: hypothetical protein SF029_01840 [bacterium]|nr:hypothetical protein [bacterium]